MATKSCFSCGAELVELSPGALWGCRGCGVGVLSAPELQRREREALRFAALATQFEVQRLLAALGGKAS